MNIKPWLEGLVKLANEFAESRESIRETRLNLLLGYIASAEFVLKQLDEGEK